MHPSTLAKRVYIFLFIVVIAFYLYGLGQIPLLGPDEPRYAQVAREMFLRSDLVTPTLGGHTWFEKPALLYWLMMDAGFANHPNEWWHYSFGDQMWAIHNELPAAIFGLAEPAPELLPTP